MLNIAAKLCNLTVGRGPGYASAFELYFEDLYLQSPYLLRGSNPPFPFLPHKQIMQVFTCTKLKSITLILMAVFQIFHPSLFQEHPLTGFLWAFVHYYTLIRVTLDVIHAS